MLGIVCQLRDNRRRDAHRRFPVCRIPILIIAIFLILSCVGIIGVTTTAVDYQCSVGTRRIISYVVLGRIVLGRVTLVSVGISLGYVGLG